MINEISCFSSFSRKINGEKKGKVGQMKCKGYKELTVVHLCSCHLINLFVAKWKSSENHAFHLNELNRTEIKQM